MPLRSFLLGAASAAALVLTALAADEPLTSFDPDKPALVSADRAVYDNDGKTVRLSGNVEIWSDGRLLTADEVSYDQNSGRVIARGHVVVREADGGTLTADEVELTGDLKDGVVENIGFILDEHTRLAATRATRENGTKTTLENAVFSPCRICVEDGQTEALWQIKSVRVVWDQTGKRISYENASFEFFGIPLLTIPAFSHADFSVKNQSGFLAPSAGSSSDLGYFVEVPYHFALDPSYDLTVTPLVATEANPQLKLDWRQLTSTGGYFLSGSYTYDDAFDSTGLRNGEQTSYSHIFGRGRFKLSDTMGWGFDLERTSNDTYLKRYDISDADRLTSDAYWEWRQGRSFASVTAYAFQGLRATDDPGLTPLVLPEAVLHYVFDEPIYGGVTAIDASLLYLTRTEGLDTQRISAGISWNRPEILEGGQAVTFFAELRGDVYRLSDVDPISTPTAEDGDILGRFSGYVGVDARWPFVRVTDDGYTQIVEPMMQVILAPYGNGPDGIPNEDSQSLEFDDTNLFNPVKFTGLDLVESGPRANIGLRYAEFFPSGGSLEVFGGFQTRLDDDPSFQNASGLGETQSDYVGRITFIPWPGLTIVNRLRLDKDDFSVRRNEVYIQGTGSWYEIDASYLKLESDPTLTGLGPREEVSLLTRLHVGDYWSVIGGIRRDLEDDQMIESRFAVAYEDECSFLEFGFRRRFTSDRDTTPSTTVILSIRLKALGDDGRTAVPLFQEDPYTGAETRDPQDYRSF
ncbi:LPS-assembly protein LptD [Alphaproteobacteria bacterium SO-S41]|nr:LPS-assembly protein LptD [Alphaproteobacteria bacterium SO-S41]